MKKDPLGEEKKRKEISQKLLHSFGNPYSHNSIAHKRRECLIEKTATEILRIEFNSQKEREVSDMRKKVFAILEEFYIKIKTSTKPRRSS